MERYFINYKNDAITTVTDPEHITSYLANGWTEITEEEYLREYARQWAKLIYWRYEK